MPRIRTVKPEFFRHHDLYLAEVESKLPIRVAFSGLWCCADREGRFKWKPTQLKLDVLPYDVLNFEDVLNCLVKNEFIVKYSIDEKEYGLIPTFKEHQRITGSEKDYESKLPPPKGNISDFQNASKEATRNNQDEKKNDLIQSIDSKDDIKGNISAFQNDTKETLWISGKGKDIGKDIGKEVPENFQLTKIYNKQFEELNGSFKNLTEIGFLKWKKFVDLIIKKEYIEIFDCKFISPQDFEKLDFPENKWEETIKSLLSTGIKPEHNLFFRIPQFIKYTQKQENATGITKSKLGNKSGGFSILTDALNKDK